MYLRFVLTGLVRHRHVNQCHKGTGGRPQGPHRGVAGSVRRHTEWGKYEQEPLVWVLQEERGKAG